MADGAVFGRPEWYISWRYPSGANGKRQSRAHEYGGTNNAHGQRDRLDIGIEQKISVCMVTQNQRPLKPLGIIFVRDSIMHRTSTCESSTRHPRR